MTFFKLCVPDLFLEEESRCGYLVPSKMKKIWSVELDLLAEFDRVCKKNDLKYFAVGGTLLGAVRHKGYIPWDDDIDLAMFRDDYEKLKEIGPKEFNHPYYFQTPYVSVENRPFVKDMFRLRNSETTMIDSMQQKYSSSSNQGVFIDIFPIDNVADDEKRQNKQLRSIKRLHSLNKFCFFCTKDHLWNHPNKLINLIRRFVALLFDREMRFLSNYYFRKYIDECKRYNKNETRRVGLLMFVINAEKLIFEREDCERLIVAPFEFSTIPIGVGFERMLTYQYGNWHKFVRGTAYHAIELMDAETPYIERI